MKLMTVSCSDAGLKTVDFMGYEISIPSNHRYIHAMRHRVYSMEEKPDYLTHPGKVFLIGSHEPSCGVDISDTIFRVEEVDGRLVAQHYRPEVA